MSQKLTGRIVFLDYMRVFAFMSVLIGHKLTPQLESFIADGSRHATLRFVAELIYPLCMGGAAGVVVFFLTSGYIITHVLQIEAPLEFVIKRLFRIYPLYMVAVILEWCMWHHLNNIPFPPLTTLIPQLLLIGDFFQTPHTLAGVEWTLRIEVMFYAFMALIKVCGGFNNQRFLPWVFLCAAAALYLLPQIPGKEVGIHGYFTLYFPFLLMGATIYLYESETASKSACVVAVGLMFISFLVLIAKLHPAWSTSHYAILALCIFLAGWYVSGRLPDGTVLRNSSDLTYAVYLFHNWLWLFLAGVVEGFGLKAIPKNLLIFFLLIGICHLMHKTIEVRGIKLGKRVLGYYRRRASLRMSGVRPQVLKDI